MAIPQIGDAFVSAQSGKAGEVVAVEPNGATGSVSIQLRQADGSLVWTSVK